MRSYSKSKLLAIVLTVVMLLSALPLNVWAAAINFAPTGNDNYYKLISKRDWELAPGINESEIVLNNEAGTQRQVTHVVEIDLNNPYTKVIPGYKEMIPTAGNYGVSSVSTMASYAEDNDYGNVVAATNTTLSWYNDAYYKSNPHLVGEPLGYVILDGELIHTNSRGQAYGAQTCIVINYNEKEIDGVMTARPADMPRVTIRAGADAITGWEEQVIPVSFGFLVKDTNNDGVGENLYLNKTYEANGTYDLYHKSGFESRTFVGVKADGTLVVVVVDGRQAPYSTGFNNYEMANYMLSLGCVVAANCDGGGSTEFMSQRPGEDLKINCSLSDGGERPSTNSILIISTAPSTGEFVRATVDTEYDYYTPGSTIKFNARGSDLVGTSVDVPADAIWQIKESGMGTIENGVFVSNGTTGTVTAQLLYNGEIMGECSVEIVVPTGLSFTQPVVTVPYGKTALVPIKATIDNGLKEVALGSNALTFTSTNTAIGRFDGLNFIAVAEADAPQDITSTVTATLTQNTEITATVKLSLGKESVILEDFENGLGNWKAIVQRNRNEAHRDFVHDLSIATKEDGQVHDGNYSLRLQTNGLSSSAVHSEQYAYVRLGIPSEEIILENARGLGFWLYVPEDNIQCWVQGFYRYDTNSDGTFDTLAEVNMMASENVYYNVDESGWHYMYMDLSDHEKVVLGDKWNVDPENPTGETGDFFIAIIFHKAINNDKWMNNGSINGPFTYYIDNITVDYSDAVEDREAPVFGKIYLNDNGSNVELIKRGVVTTTGNSLSFTANVAECTDRVAATGESTPLSNYTGIDADSVKAYIDGVEVPCTYADGKISISNVAVADGYHRVKFEICDNAGNKAIKIRVIKVESGVNASTIQFVPADATLDRLYGGSVYWMNMNATAIETIKSVTAVIDLNNVNHWQLDNMELADGFTAEYTIAEETNTATITITRTGKNTQTGAATLAKLPVRIVYFDTDMKIPGYTAETFWKTYNLWPHDLKMDVDKGVITFAPGYESSVRNTFSNEEFQVDTEIYTNSANMDVAYRNEKGTAHVHTPAAIDDKASTCTQPGYTDRTYCEVCSSVVDWGTTVKATGHTYKVSGNKIACHCGDAHTETGLVTLDGNTYYTVAGTLTSGWLTVDEVWHYFDTTTYKGVNGSLTYQGITYQLENGRLLSGVWVNNGVGTRYYYGPSYYYTKGGGNPYANVVWAEIDGNTYAFDKKGYRHEGIRVLVESTQDAKLYEFTDEGVLIGEIKPDHTGIYFCNGMTTYLEDGIPVAAGLVKEGNDYYYINSGCIAVTGAYNITRTNRLLQAGLYRFDETGKMINPPKITDGPQTNGFFYLNGKQQLAYQLVEFDGDYYFIYDANKIAKNQRLYISAEFLAGTPFTPGYYNFDTEGKLVTKNGPQDDGYFYIKGVRQTGYQVIEYEDAYYYIHDGDKYATSTTLYLSADLVAGTSFALGYYDFDAEGKLIIKNGPQTDGYFYVNGARQEGNKLLEYNGDYYYVYNDHKYVTNGTYTLDAALVEGTPFAPGSHSFDANGKLIVKHGPQDDGYLYLYGVRQDCYQLVNFEGDYYLIYDAHKYVTNGTRYLTPDLVEGTPFTVGYYDFDAEGKLIMKHGPQDDGYLYLYGVRQNCYQLVNFEGDYYLIYDAHKYVTNGTRYLTPDLVEGTPFTVGYYDFDAEGKMIIKNGPQPDGYFYLNGVRQTAYQVVEYENNYYYIYDGHKIAKNVTLYIMPEHLRGTYFVEWYYSFDEEGKMIGYIPGVVNGRDIGAIPYFKTSDGKDIKEGLLIRGTELDNADSHIPVEWSSIGIDILKTKYGIKFDMDLRSPLVGGRDMLGDDVTHKYYDMVYYAEVFTAKGKAKVKEVFTDLANPANYPVYLHCTHGIDRAGTVTYILGALLGVPENYLANEYMLSIGAYGNSILKVRDGIKKYSGATLKDKAAAYLLDCGITQEQIDTIRNIFIEN